MTTNSQPTVLISEANGLDAADYLKYLVEEAGHLLESAADNLGANGYDQHLSAAEHASHLDHVQALIAAAHREIVEAAAVFSRDGDDLATYSDGRRATTTCEVETGCYFTFTRHPDRGHRNNRPREICVVDCRDGARKRIVLRADHTIEAVPVQPLRAVK